MNRAVTLSTTRDWSAVSQNFSRALTEGLMAQQTDAEFDAALGESIASIFAASTT